MSNAEHLAKLRKQARLAFKNTRYEEAIAYYHQLIVEGDGQDGDTRQATADRIELGTAYMRVSRFAEAEREFEAVIAAEPENAAAFNKIGLSNIRLGHPKKALEALRSAARLAPKEAAYQWALAELAIAVGDRAEAEAAIDATLEADPEHKEAEAARRSLDAQPVAAFSSSTRSASDADFASLVDFIKSRPAEDAPPVRTVDRTYRPVVYVVGGSLAFLAIYLYVRLVMIG